MDMYERSFCMFQQNLCSGRVLRDEMRREIKNSIMEAEWLRLRLWSNGRIFLRRVIQLDQHLTMMILESGRCMAAESQVRSLSLFELGSTYRRDSLGRKLSPRKSLSTVMIAKGMQGTSNKSLSTLRPWVPTRVRSKTLRDTFLLRESSVMTTLFFYDFRIWVK